MRVRGCGLIERDGQILTLVYNYPNGRIHAIPGGGVKSGETLEAAVIREYQEELGIEVAIHGLRYVGDMMARENIPQTVHVIFDAELISGEPTLNPAETSAQDVAWLPLSSLDEKRLYPAINDAIKADLDNPNNARYLGDCMTREWA